MKMSEHKRLHPVAAVISFFKGLKEAIFPFAALFLFGGKGIGMEFWEIAVALAFILFSLIYGILSWLRFTYRVEEGELRIESGFIVKKKRYIPIERIQSLDFSEGIFQRIFGLVKVKVETAGSGGPGEAEAVLTAITKDEANSIQEILTSVKNSGKVVTEGQEQRSETMFKINPMQLFMLGSTSGGAWVVISAVFAFAMQFDDWIPFERVFNEMQVYIKNGIVFISIIVFLVLLFAWLIAIVATMLKYAQFTVKRVDEDLIISRGLLEKRQVTIPLNRIQGILISENLIRQPLRLATVSIISAGGTMEKDGSSTSRIQLLPIIKKKEIPTVLTTLIDEYHFLPEIVPAPKRALKRYLFRCMIVPILIIIASLIFFLPWGYLSLLLLPPSFIWGYLKYKEAGWNIHGQQLTLTYRGLVKNTAFMKKNKIQTITIRKSYFQDKRALGSVISSVKSGVGTSGGMVEDLETQDLLKIYEWYHYS